MQQEELLHSSALERINSLISEEPWTEETLSAINRTLREIGLGHVEPPDSRGMKVEDWLVPPQSKAISLDSALNVWLDAEALPATVREHLTKAAKSLASAKREVMNGGQHEFDAAVSLNEAKAALWNAARHMEAADRAILPEPEEKTLQAQFAQLQAKHAVERAIAASPFKDVVKQGKELETLELDALVSLALGEMMEGNPMTKNIRLQDLPDLRRFLLVQTVFCLESMKKDTND